MTLDSEHQCLPVEKGLSLLVEVCKPQPSHGEPRAQAPGKPQNLPTEVSRLQAFDGILASLAAKRKTASKVFNFRAQSLQSLTECDAEVDFIDLGQLSHLFQQTTGFDKPRCHLRRPLLGFAGFERIG